MRQVHGSLNASLARSAAVLLVLACGGSSDSGTGPPPTGSLEVTISAPAGVSTPVAVIGIAGYSQLLSTSQTLTGLTPGDYFVSASPGASADLIVGNLYSASITGSPAAVSANATSAATVTYAASGTPGRLWIANQTGNAIAGYSAAQLSASGSPAPATMIGSANHPGANAGNLAIDASGGMWVSNGSDTLFYFSASQIASTTTAAPARRIVGANASITSITGLAFDAQGNLWLADQADRVLEFTPAQLEAGGPVTPNVTLTTAFGSIKRPWDIAFDAHGNLWVCNYGNNSIAAFTPAQISVSGSPQPSLGLTGTRGLTGPLGIAFDRGGNLWVGSIIDTIAKFSSSDLAAVGSPTPAVLITGSMRTPISLAFDDSDGLWVASYQGSHLMRYLASQLQTTGAPVPSVTISGTAFGLPAGIAFAPHAGALPLR
jgi:sugar lactone lactonase YvrE